MRKRDIERQITEAKRQIKDGMNKMRSFNYNRNLREQINNDWLIDDKLWYNVEKLIISRKAITPPGTIPSSRPSRFRWRRCRWRRHVFRWVSPEFRRRYEWLSPRHSSYSMASHCLGRIPCLVGYNDDWWSMRVVRCHRRFQLCWLEWRHRRRLVLWTGGTRSPCTALDKWRIHVRAEWVRDRLCRLWSLRWRIRTFRCKVLRLRWKVPCGSSHWELDRILSDEGALRDRATRERTSETRKIGVLIV